MLTLAQKSPRAFGVSNCPRCGRFARASYVTEYNGWFNCIYVTTYCANCGEVTENTT